MNFQKIRLEYTNDGRIARVTLAAPKANILDEPMMSELSAAFSEAGSHAVHAIVLGAEGPHFSFGASVEEHLPHRIAMTLAELHLLLQRVADSPAPVIAAVRGQCLGGGFELALACDLIFCETSAQFACPEIKLGVFAPAASALLPVKIGQALASRLLLAADTMSGAEAAERSLAARAVQAGTLETALESWLASDFLPRSASSLGFASRATRAQIQKALRDDLPRLERLYLDELMNTPDPAEGIRAFMEKRAPKWSAAAVGKK